MLPAINVQMFLQLQDSTTSFYILSLFRKAENDSFSRKSIAIPGTGVYFSRYGVLHICSIIPIVKDPGFPKSVRMFDGKAT